MDNQRLILFVALSLVTLLLWQAWQEEHSTATRPAPVSVPASGTTSPAAESPADLPGPAVSPATTPEAGPDGPPGEATKAIPKGERIHVRTDVLDLVIDTNGGDIRSVKLPKYPVSIDQPDVPYQLLTDQPPYLFVAQAGLKSTAPAPTHHARYQVSQQVFTLQPGEETLEVPLVWEQDGVKVTKTFRLTRGSYVVDIVFKVDNRRSEPWRGSQYRQFQRTEDTGAPRSRLIYTYTGGVIYSPEDKYEKIDFEEMQERDLGRRIVGGWAAMIQHYFLAAWLPAADETNFFYSKVPAPERYILGLISTEKTIAAGDSGVFSTRAYLGPKVQDVLADLAEGLELTVDYGILTFLAKPLFWLLKQIHALVGNWGWSIVLLTLIIKLAFYKLSAASYRSMANMRRLAPKIQQLRERYGEDRQRMSKAMMDLYKKEKINPMGGCLPMLVQIPVFIALYWVLLESVELRQAEFILWIKDLSTKDPYYVLPLLMGASMLLQQKLHPPPPDPVQAKVMMVLPIVFTLFFAFFPSGLVLYWVANNIFSMAQQWYVMHQHEKAIAKAKGSH